MGEALSSKGFNADITEKQQAMFKNGTNYKFEPFQIKFLGFGLTLDDQETSKVVRSGPTQISKTAVFEKVTHDYYNQFQH